MNNHRVRDDSYKSRLSSFLSVEGKLKVRKIRKIKDSVYYVETENVEQLILKGSVSLKKVVQQQQFFNQIDIPFVNKFVCFGNHSKIIKGFGLYWTIVPYIHGQTLRFCDEADRKDTLSIIRKFHQISRGVYLKNPILKLPMYLKWNQRLIKLQQTKKLMFKFGYGRLYLDIIRISQERLAYFSNLDWGKIEKKAVDQTMWVHGDVASHNFIRDNSGDIHIIDFDLMSLAPILYDYIQLGQRFSPYLNWNIDQLLPYFTWLDEQDLIVWLSGISIPADLIREWWHFTLRKPTESQYLSYLQSLTSEWEQRLQFVERIQNMLT